MKRGDVVPVAIPGYDKPRPGIVMQSDLLSDTDSILILPLTTMIRIGCVYRPEIEITPENGLLALSQAMADKITVVPRTKCGKVFGKVDQQTMDQVTGAVAFALGFLDQD